MYLFILYKVFTVLPKSRASWLFQPKVQVLDEPGIESVFPGTAKLDWFFLKNATPYISQP